MQSTRWKKASLAINSIIRGLELDQVMFHYDEITSRALTIQGAVELGRRAKVAEPTASSAL